MIEQKITSSVASNLRRDALIAEADRVFGDPDKARRWLSKPKWFLHKKTPFDVLETTSGYETIEGMLIRIEHGMIG
jgi:putative toxin-antitoxin system antitoxin component (TIGR02293 family)